MRTLNEVGNLGETSPMIAKLPMIGIDIEVSGGLIQSDAFRKG